MKINTHLLPIKLHYFFFMGCLAPVLPFLMVLSRQLGIPVAIQGTLSAITLITTVVCKPFIAALADKYPKARKAIFVLLLIMMVVFYGVMVFIPRIIEAPFLQGRILNRGEVSETQNSFQTSGKTLTEVEAWALQAKNINDGGCQRNFVSFEEGDCFASSGWDCRIAPHTPLHPSSPFNNTAALPDSPPATSFPTFLASNTSQLDLLYTLSLDSKQTMNQTYNWTAPLGSTKDGGMRVYQMSSEMPGCDVSSFVQANDLTLACEGGSWDGDGCPNVWGIPYFWAFTLVTLVATIFFSTANSITDAICVDSVGEEGDYGSQRAWGSVGWGLVGPLSGHLVDTWSGPYALTKIYEPAFILLFVLGGFDVLVAAFSLHVPRLEKGGAVWPSVRRLLTQKRFLLFLFFVVMAGSLDGSVANWLFVLQEDMAVRSGESMAHMKLLQGLTLFVQCFFEVPFMYASGPILRRLGAERVISLVFFLYAIRFGAISLVGAFGKPWATLLVELLNGPCYGLGYTAVVVYAGSLAPPGTSATVQSVVNICYEAIGYSIALFVGGVLFQSVGGPFTYLVYTAVAVLGFILHLLSCCCSAAPTASPDANPEQGARNTEVTYSEIDGAKVTTCALPT